jgi:hypothetical protein
VPTQHIIAETTVFGRLNTIFVPSAKLRKAVLGESAIPTISITSVIFVRTKRPNRKPPVRKTLTKAVPTITAFPVVLPRKYNAVPIQHIIATMVFGRLNTIIVPRVSSAFLQNPVLRENAIPTISIPPVIFVRPPSPQKGKNAGHPFRSRRAVSMNTALVAVETIRNACPSLPFIVETMVFGSRKTIFVPSVFSRRVVPKENAIPTISIAPVLFVPAKSQKKEPTVRHRFLLKMRVSMNTALVAVGTIRNAVPSLTFIATRKVKCGRKSSINVPSVSLWMAVPRESAIPTISIPPVPLVHTKRPNPEPPVMKLLTKAVPTNTAWLGGLPTD